MVACLSKQLARKQEGIQQFRAKVDTFKEKAAAKAGKFFKVDPFIENTNTYTSTQNLQGSSQLALFLLRSSIWLVLKMPLYCAVINIHKPYHVQCNAGLFSRLGVTSQTPSIRYIHLGKKDYSCTQLCRVWGRDRACPTNLSLPAQRRFSAVC